MQGQSNEIKPRSLLSMVTDVIYLGTQTKESQFGHVKKGRAYSLSLLLDVEISLFLEVFFKIYQSKFLTPRQIFVLDCSLF